MIRVRVVAFASAADLIGAPEVTVELAADSTLADLRHTLESQFIGLTDAWPRLAIAVNSQLVRGDETPPLADDSEVALLPPVSGGSEAALHPLVDNAIDVDTVCRAVAGPGRGATVLFLGTVRDHHGGRAVERLDYSGYAPMAATALRRIIGELEAAADGLRVAIVHRLGEVPLGEPSVVIATASPHRQEAYAASRTALERLKREVPIWKREHYKDGEITWREEEPLTATQPS